MKSTLKASNGWYEHSLPDDAVGYSLYVVDNKAVLSSYMEQDVEHEANNFGSELYSEEVLGVIHKAIEGRAAKQMDLDSFIQLVQSTGISVDGIRETIERWSNR